MPTPQNKEELITAITTSYEKLSYELDSIPKEARNISMPGHIKDTQMSIENLLSYLIGWWELVLKWIEKDELWEEIDFPETGYKWNELGKIAQKFYTDYENLSFEELKDKLERTVQTLLTKLEEKSEVELYWKDWYKNYTLGRMIQFNTSSPYKNALTRIRKWKKENNIL